MYIIYLFVVLSASIIGAISGVGGGVMIKNMCPGRTVNYVRNNRISAGHVQTVQYMTSVTV